MVSKISVFKEKKCEYWSGLIERYGSKQAISVDRTGFDIKSNEDIEGTMP